MSDIQAGAPPNYQSGRLTDFGRQVKKLVETAAGTPGEWFSIPLQANTNSAQASARNQIAAWFTELSVRDGRLWLKVKP